jgi:pimeloyl-ACP methyl ester carboxylesterase
MKVIVDNIATEYVDSGEGKTILMLHGWMDNLKTFDGLVGCLGNNFRVVRPDMPGFGQTEPPTETWDVSKYVEFVSHFLEKIEVSPDVILGHSFGGRVTIKGVSGGIFKAKKIILVGSAGISKSNTLRNIIITVLAKIFSLITLIPPLLFFRHKIRRKAYQIIGSDYMDSMYLKETFLKVISEDLLENARNINVPTQLIWGRNDTETPIADGEKYNEVIKNSKLSVIEGAGHLVHKEKSQEVAEIIRGFLC